jgi:hypothetical protein
MALAILFSPDSMTEEQYRDTLRRVDAAGEGANSPGKIFHVCFRDGDKLRVLDVWENEESFQRFGGVLMPILQQAGVNPGQPQVYQTVNVEVSPQPVAA